MRTIKYILNELAISSISAHIHTRSTKSLFAALCVSASFLAACGGGSSGTGESGSQGQIIDESCQPVADLDMSTLGVSAIEEFSTSNGSFTLAPGADLSGAIADMSPVEPVDTSQPFCVLIVYQQGVVVSVRTYPLEDLPECSIDGVRGAAHEDTPPLCDAGIEITPSSAS